MTEIKSKVLKPKSLQSYANLQKSVLLNYSIFLEKMKK